VYVFGTSRSVLPSSAVIRRESEVSVAQSSLRKARSVLPRLCKVEKSTGSRKRSDWEPSTVVNSPNFSVPYPRSAPTSPVEKRLAPAYTAPWSGPLASPDLVVRLMTAPIFSPNSAGTLP